MTKKFVRKDATVEAYQWKGDGTDLENCPPWLKTWFADGWAKAKPSVLDPELTAVHLHHAKGWSRYVAHPGWWVLSFDQYCHWGVTDDFGMKTYFYELI